MTKRVSRLLRDVLGRNDQVFLGLLGEQFDAAVQATELLCQAVGGTTPVEEIAAAVDRIEGEGDERRSELIAELSAALTTPIDREDLFRLSRSVDDVLDNLRDFANELALYGVLDRDVFAPVLEALVQGLHALRASVMQLDDLAAVQRSSREAKRANNVHRTYQECLAQLFGGEFTMDVLKTRELLRRLDIVGLRLEEAADVLADAGLKRG